MAKAKAKPPELGFQDHIAAFLRDVHGFVSLKQEEISDTVNAIAEDRLWAFLQRSQPERLQALAREYGTDARAEVFRALRLELGRTPLWLILRGQLDVRGHKLHLYFPPPRSSASVAHEGHAHNEVSFRHHFYFGPAGKPPEEIDFVLFLNGLPIAAVELKHDKNQNVHHAVAQFTNRDHTHRIFSHPFLYVAADTTEVQVATDPRRTQNFRWHNTGLKNEPRTKGEYPVEFLYREVLSAASLIEAIAFYLVYVPARPAADGKPAQSAATIFPRYHQIRSVEKISAAAVARVVKHGDVGQKLLVHHSAGSGKTLTMCWLADRLQSLYKPGTDQKLIDTVFVLTDRKSLDTNIRDDIEKFTHLKDVVGLARKAEDLPRFLKKRRAIIVTTQQKFAWILKELKTDASLAKRRVAFLIDEAHRSQEGQLGAAIRLPFRDPGTPAQEAEEPDAEDAIAQIIQANDLNQLFVAFTATPAPATLALFGQPFDQYTEWEAIQEGYILDVARSILSYKTLYHLHCPILPSGEDEMAFPKGVVSKALQTVAYEDESLIQYKAEIIVRIFEEQVAPLIGGRAKAMVVAASRVAGLRYYQVLSQKLADRHASYGVLYAFADFVHPTDGETYTEFEVNGLTNGELIEERFERDDFRLMVVASKFQTGFDQPLLAGMFLDKPVAGPKRRADRLSPQPPTRRQGHGRRRGLHEQRRGDHAGVREVSQRRHTARHRAIPRRLRGAVQRDPRLAGLHAGRRRFTRRPVAGEQRPGCSDPRQRPADRFNRILKTMDERKELVRLMASFVSTHQFMTCFATFSDAVTRFTAFAAYVGPQLVKEGAESDLMRAVRQVLVTKTAVRDVGEVRAPEPKKLVRVGGKGGTGGGAKGGPPPSSVATVQEMIDALCARFDISDEEALYIREVTEEKSADPGIRSAVKIHLDDKPYLDGPLRTQVNTAIQGAYAGRGRYEALGDPKYTDNGGIFDTMAHTVIVHHSTSAA
jgi:type I restriction enzyme R subunit